MPNGTCDATEDFTVGGGRGQPDPGDVEGCEMRRVLQHGGDAVYVLPTLAGLSPTASLETTLSKGVRKHVMVCFT